MKKDLFYSLVSHVKIGDAMNFRIDPLSFSKLITEIMWRKDQKVSEFISKAADDAELLASIWEEIARAADHGTIVDEKRMELLKAHRFLPRNGAPLSRLHGIYRQLSRTYGKRNGDEWLQEFSFGLSSVLEKREVAQNLINKLTKNFTNAVFLDKNNGEHVGGDLASAVAAMRNEAGTLRALAMRIDAIGT